MKKILQTLVDKYDDSIDYLADRIRSTLIDPLLFPNLKSAREALEKPISETTQDDLDAIEKFEKRYNKLSGNPAKGTTLASEGAKQHLHEEKALTADVEPLSASFKSTEATRGTKQDEPQYNKSEPTTKNDFTP